MSKIRVLQILDKLDYGSGVSSVVLNYYNHIDREKIQFDFMVNEPVSAELEGKMKEMGARIYRMPPLRLHDIKDYKRQLHRFFTEHKEYKIIHGHVANASAFYLRAAKKYGVPIRILHSHNSAGADIWYKKIRNRILSKIGILNANYYAACGIAAAKYLFGNRKKVYILNNAIDPGKYQYNCEARNRMRKKLNLENAFVIGHVGRFCRQKNQIFLLQILKKILEEKPEAYLLLIGEGRDKRKIVKAAAKLQLQSRIVMTGKAEKVWEFLQAMDVFVLPSRYEGLPVACIEAEASGLPCVVSSNVTKEIETGQVTFLSLKDSAADWADCIIQLENHQRISHLRECFFVEKQAAKLEAYYEGLFNQ